MTTALSGGRVRSFAFADEAADVGDSGTSPPAVGGRLELDVGRRGPAGTLNANGEAVARKDWADGCCWARKDWPGSRKEWLKGVLLAGSVAAAAASWRGRCW